MYQLSANGDLNLVTVFLWHVAFVYLIVLMFLSYVIYRNSADKIFLLYFSYVGLLFTYVICRNYYFLEIQTYLPVYLYSYYVQVIYLCVYFHFGISILNFKAYYPNFMSWVYYYLWIAAGAGGLVFLAALLGWVHPSWMADYYLKLFFPVHISIALIIIYKAIRLRQESQRIYFLTGSLSYLTLGVVAVLTSAYESYDFIIRPVAFFYMAIIIESTFFAIGLGLRVQQMYQSKLEMERRLNSTQQKLQMQMMEQIRQQESDNIVLRQEKELQTLATQVALLENKVLRSQMNAHFIFNVLNSIKAFIIENDARQAIRYLSKFSKLMRRILDGSIYEKRTLSDELATIELYLDIEKMRLSEELTIDIQVNTKRNLDLIPFPALLLQPFVENAIWHGLKPSLQPEKELTIKVNESPEGIVVEVSDNGVGYSNSLARKVKQDTHRSYGMSIIKERIVQYNKRNPLFQIDFDIEDLQPSSGTLVRIRIETD